MRSILYWSMFALLSTWSVSSYADKFSDSYLTLKVIDGKIEGRWDIALRDLDFAIGLDQDGNGEITWDEVRSKHTAISAYALSRLTLAADGFACRSQAVRQLVDHHSDGAYSVLEFTAVCPAAVKSLTVQYRLLFDIDPQHKGLLKLERNGTTVTAVFDPNDSKQTFHFAKQSRVGQFGEYIVVGVEHIWVGFDHLLFLFSLLLPSAFIYVDKRWRPVKYLKTSVADVLKIVTAFTLAHSVTLTLATLHVISLSSRWVESGIALTVVVAALNNLFPVVQGRRWVAAFAFGLIHGFGFASVLADLGLPPLTLALALVGFNLGVELGQLVIVAVFLSLAYGLRRTRFYRYVIFTLGSLLIVLLATVWFIERAFNMQLFYR